MNTLGMLALAILFNAAAGFSWQWRRRETVTMLAATTAASARDAELRQFYAEAASIMFGVAAIAAWANLVFALLA